MINLKVEDPGEGRNGVEVEGIGNFQLLTLMKHRKWVVTYTTHFRYNPTTFHQISYLLV